MEYINLRLETCVAWIGYNYEPSSSTHHTGGTEQHGASVNDIEIYSINRANTYAEFSMDDLALLGNEESVKELILEQIGE